jgi:uncharacterized protein (TIGR02271 family)
MFDSRNEAEAARERLAMSSINPESVRILDQNSSQSSSGQTSSGQGGNEVGFWTAVKDAFMPDEDRHAYEEGVRRGGFLVCAQVDEGQADEACRILEQSGSVDFDQRQQDWRGEGWQGYQAQQSTASSQTETRGAVEEERIPIVEEQLRVGKREVSRGGARVRSYMQETPVHEQVNLREEHVSVERRPVNETLSASDLDRSGLLEEREVSMTARSEEAVVAKEAQIREELVVRKTSEQRTENIQETVRHTEVDVEDGRTGGTESRGAFGFSDASPTGTSEEERSKDGAMQNGR